MKEKIRKLERSVIKNDLFIKKEIDSLIRSKIYKKEDDVIVDALKALLKKTTVETRNCCGFV